MTTGPSDILVIGGSGFLSGAVVRQALSQGHRVWTVTRGLSPVPKGAIPILADRHDPVAFARAVTQTKSTWDLVIDCIAYSPADVRQDVEVFSNLAKHLVLVSTDFVYHPNHRHFPQPESPAEYVTSGYGGQKREAESALIAAETGAMSWSIVRPCHIYGPGSQLGCLPLHSRDTELIGHLRAGKPLQLAGGGHFLQQPVLADDLARTILGLSGNPLTQGRIYNVAGPDVVESREYYHLIASILGVELHIEEVPVDEHLRAHPEAAPYLCHRIYDLGQLRAASVPVPETRLSDGLRLHVASLLGR